MKSWSESFKTEVRFASFLSGGFTTMAVINPPERKLVKRTSVQRLEICGVQMINPLHRLKPNT